MRKICLQTVLNASTFAPTSILVIKNEDGTKTVFKKVHEFDNGPLSKYTAEQRMEIAKINHLLSENNQPEMTSEEMDWAIEGPFGHWNKRAKETTEEELQLLSGYRVEKRIIYTDGVKENG